MKSLIILFCAALSAVNGNVLKYIPQFGGKPDFCHKLDCPGFEVERKTKEYELRKYDPTVWVATRTTGVDFMEAARKNFMKLFKYIDGYNVKKQKIAMTAPVLIKIIPGQGPACESDFTMYFFVSPTEGTPPKPLDPTVYFTCNGTASVYVRSFPGYVREIDTYLKQAEKLAEALKGREYIKDYYFVAGYDSPYRFLDRHNEIWFLAEDSLHCKQIYASDDKHV